MNAQVLQQTLKTLDRAFSDMRAKGNGFPRFKKKMRSFVFPAMVKNCLGQGKVKLPQLGWLLIKQSRDYPTGFEAKQARIFKKASGYYVMLTFQSLEQCPDAPVGKVSLSERVHRCQFCGYQEQRDVASAKVIKNRGLIAVGQPVIQNACGDVLTGVKQLNLFNLVKSL